ncbi:tetratricopeptide repeat protein 27-like isoform X2 [Liolophura sinensis]|uniref:tetratricopeptide repeat protein 27-like isoform X2 n=1 Tax=Liolophura sinensis TaxID=3198878 RepID=UPI003158863E
MNTPEKIEEILLQGIRPMCAISGSREITENLTLLLNGKYESVLDHQVARVILKGDNPNKEMTPEELKGFFTDNVQKFLASEGGDPKLKCLCVLGVAVSCLQLFVQNNWTGPKTTVCPSSFLLECFHIEEKKVDLKQCVMASLSSDGEGLYELVVSPEYLFVAKTLLCECKQLQQLQTADWWLMRCIRLQQEFLDDKSPSLKSVVMECVDKLSKKELLLTDSPNNRHLIVQFHLECGHLCHMYYEYRQAKIHFETAETVSGVKVEFTGALGKRTKFQVEHKAQLAVVVSRQTGETTETNTIKTVTNCDESLQLPKDLALNDETVLEQINFTNPSEVSTVTFSDLEAVLMIGLLEDHRRTAASHDTLNEELEAWISAVTSQPRVWSVQLAVLYLRSKLQKSSSRRVDRSMRQIEELVRLADKLHPEASQRLPYFHTVKTPSLTTMQTELADILMSLGAFGSACEVFERLHKWEDVISCYHKIGKTEKAETLIREQLSIKETPNLYCFLGDVTRDIEYYEKAWELSNHRSARAQRGIAYLYMGKQMFEKSLECFEKSLKINSLQIPVWFTYGCAALGAKRYETAAQAFHRCVTLDYDNFEAWANLSTAYVRLNQKPRAFSILQDAIKCCYTSWRLWENALVIGTDCREFTEVIQAYHRLLDLKDKYMDVEVLKILCMAIAGNIPDAKGQPCGQLRPKALELFGRIASKGITSADAWEAYALLCDTDEEGFQDKCLQYLKKAHQYAVQENNWEKDAKKCMKVGKLSLKLAEAYSKCIQSSSPAQALPLASSCKLLLKSCATKIKEQQQTDLGEDLSNVCQSLEEQVEKYSQIQAELKSS